MPEEILIQYTSPTLAGLKPGNLFTFRFSGKADMRDSIQKMNRTLVPKGLCMIPLRGRGERTLVYLFRPSMVEEKLSDSKAREILDRYGYREGTMGRKLSTLISRMRQEEDFPHEIGLFLGYPPEDVEGFIANRAKNAKYTGTWKVYGDEERAKRTFRKYERCTEIYSRQRKKGMRLEKLIVPAS